MGPRASPHQQTREEEVAHLWEACGTLRGSLVTTQGQRIRVLYPGRPSSEAGPDFRDALLLTQRGELLQGDVEVHLRQGDWRSHGHHRDPRYNGVVLHAVLWLHGREASLERGTSVPVVTLRPTGRDWRRRLKGARAEQPDQGGVHLLSWYRTLPPEELGALLDRAGGQRFLRKSQRFQRALQEEPPDQVLYAALLDGLGYSQNREAFQAVARHLPWHALQEKALQALPGERHEVVEALLLGAADLLPGRPQGPEGSAGGPYLERLAARWRTLGLQPACPPVSWELFRVRPGNHPVRRLGGAAYLLEPYLEGGLAVGMEALVWEASCARIEASLHVPGVGPWATGGASGSAHGRPAALIGRGRARDLLVNVLLPFFHAWGHGRDGLRAQALWHYREAPLLQENAITREMRRLLRPARGLVSGGLRQQGLIHLYRTLFTSPGP